LDKVSSVDWRDSIFEEDLPEVEQFWYKVTVLKQAGTCQIRSKKPFESGKMNLPHRTGLCACYVDLDEADGKETVMCLVVDISEQKWIEDKLLERTKKLEDSESRYRTLADLSPLGIVSTDRDGYIQFGNDAWHDFYGFTKGEVKDPQPWVPYI
jgi:PAS domain-containing protein